MHTRIKCFMGVTFHSLVASFLFLPTIPMFHVSISPHLESYEEKKKKRAKKELDRARLVHAYARASQEQALDTTQERLNRLNELLELSIADKKSKQHLKSLEQQRKQYKLRMKRLVDKHISHSPLRPATADRKYYNEPQTYRIDAQSPMRLAESLPDLLAQIGNLVTADATSSMRLDSYSALLLDAQELGYTKEWFHSVLSAVQNPVIKSLEETISSNGSGSIPVASEGEKVGEATTAATGSQTRKVIITTYHEIPITIEQGTQVPDVDDTGFTGGCQCVVS